MTAQGWYHSSPDSQTGTGLSLQQRDPGAGADRAKSASLDVQSWTPVFNNGGFQYGKDKLPKKPYIKYRRRQPLRKDGLPLQRL